MNISLDVEVLVKNGTLVLTDRDGKAITFSPEQSVQKKVSMITLGELCDLPKIRLAQAFGFKTRKSYYDIRDAVLNGLPADLLPKRTGPQNAPKRTREVEALILRRRYETDLNMYQIADELTRLGFSVSARLVAQVLADYGLCKKTADIRVAPSTPLGQGGNRGPRRRLQTAQSCCHPPWHRA